MGYCSFLINFISDLFLSDGSVVSTQSMLGLPTEVYLTGAMILWQVVAISIGTSFAAYVYLPLFHDLGILSINQVK